METKIKSKSKLAALKAIRAHVTKLPNRRFKVGDLVKETRWCVIDEKTGRLVKPYILRVNYYLVIKKSKKQQGYDAKHINCNCDTRYMDWKHTHNIDSHIKTPLIKNGQGPCSVPMSVLINFDYEIVTEMPL